MLLTTQYLEEADALADEITVIDHGRVIAHDTPDGLKRVIGGQRIASARRTRRGCRTCAILTEVAGGAPENTGRGMLTVPVDDEAALRRRVPAGRRRHRRHRAVPPPAEPRRGLLDADRPTRQRRPGGRSMTATPTLTAPARPTMPAPHTTGAPAAWSATSGTPCSPRGA